MSKKDEGGRPRSGAVSSDKEMGGRETFSDPKHNVMEAAQHFKMSDRETLLATFKGIGDRMKKTMSSGRSSPASDASSVSPMGTPTSLDSPKTPKKGFEK